MIPTYEEIMLPFLSILKDGEEHSLRTLYDELEDHFNLTDEERRELLPSGKQAIFRNRVGWASTYMKKAGLLISPKRAYFTITKRGVDLLKEGLADINGNVLKRYPEFVEFQTVKKTEKRSGTDEVRFKDQSNNTPEEALEYAYLKLKSDLGKEIIEVIKSCSPAFFEKLVVDLMINMGYGGSRKDAGEAMGKSGDGGIDGIIKEDRLGLDTIYLQAKRWDKTVPVKEIRDFTGALASKKARKGIFITTSDFPKSALEFVKQIEYKIILIDGETLTDLMIAHNVGVSVINQYEVKTIDSDYFEDF